MAPGSTLQQTSQSRTNQNTAVLPNPPLENFNESYLLPELVPPAFDEEACMEQRQQPTPLTQIHPEMIERNPPRKQQQIQI